MEIDITKFFEENRSPRDYFASAAEIGNSAARVTWQHACEDSADYILLDTEEKRAAFWEFAKSCGFDGDCENLDALFLQWVAGDCREMGLNTPSDFENIDWLAIEEEQREGLAPSNIFRGDDGRIYFNAEA